MGAISEKAPAKPEGVDGAEMAHKERQTFVQDRREVSPGKSHQGAKPSRVRCHYEGKAGREEDWQTVRRTTKTHSPENREV